MEAEIGFGAFQTLSRLHLVSVVWHPRKVVAKVVVVMGNLFAIFAREGKRPRAELPSGMYRYLLPL